jgi:hypothetical protein
MKPSIYLAAIFFLSGAVCRAAPLDCSEAYGKKDVLCERIICDAKYAAFVGKWTGPFSAYVRELSGKGPGVYRPFQNTVTYSESDCLRRIDNGDVFIIGRRTDSYPAFKKLPAKVIKGLLITGKRADGTPFLRTVDEDGVNDYKLEYQNKPANVSAWSLAVPATGESPEMRFSTIDAQDFSAAKAHKRNVTVTMSVGPAGAPYWEGVVSSGYHVLKK